MDFITDLLPLAKFDIIYVVIDQFSKMTHFILYKKTIVGEETTKLFIDNIYCYHGLPNDIIFDYGPQFISKF